MYMKDFRRLFCLAAVVPGLILLGLGLYLLLTAFSLSYISIGAVVSGITLLIVTRLTHCLRVPCIFCLLLTLVSIFLILSGILAIVLASFLELGLILVGLGVFSVILTAACLSYNLNCVTYVQKGCSG